VCPSQGSVVVREVQSVAAKLREDGTPVMRERRVRPGPAVQGLALDFTAAACCMHMQVPTVLHCDLIKDEPFWTSRPKLLQE
jgi:hypothetical protein